MLHPSLWLFYHRTDVFATFVNRSVIVHYPKGESGVVVAQHTGHCLDIHAVLQCQGCEGMAEVMKSDVFQPCVFQNIYQLLEETMPS